MQTSAPIRAVAFDLYGTLLDVRSVEIAAAGVAADATALVALWRAKQLEYAFLRTLMGRYQDFWRVTADALDHALDRFAIRISSERRDAFLNAWLALEPFPEVAAALDSLLGLPLAILSNGSPMMLGAALSHSRLRDRFAHVLSVDAVRQYKPAASVYELATTAFGLPPREILFVSANGFDVAGASHFGYSVAWVNRAGLPPDRLEQSPRYVVGSLTELAAWVQLDRQQPTERG